MVERTLENTADLSNLRMAHPTWSRPRSTTLWCNALKVTRKPASTSQRALVFGVRASSGLMVRDDEIQIAWVISVSFPPYLLCLILSVFHPSYIVVHAFLKQKLRGKGSRHRILHVAASRGCPCGRHWGQATLVTSGIDRLSTI